MSDPRTCTIVPVKALERAKRRLSPVLPDAAREQLVRTMLEDVLAAATAAADGGPLVVVTPDPRIAALARGYDAVVLPEPVAGELNAAAATGLAYAGAVGCRAALVLPADVPLVTAAEVRALLASRAGRPGVTLAPAHDGDGTNGLLLAPPAAITPCYGRGSYLQHVSQAMARRVDVNVVHLAGLARDIDQPVDLAMLAAAKSATDGRYDFLGPHLATLGYAPDAASLAEEQ